ncbi:hypothetical protein ACQPW3_11035 [Actinosynnema sp. CA-248983]
MRWAFGAGWLVGVEGWLVGVAGWLVGAADGRSVDVAEPGR